MALSDIDRELLQECLGHKEHSWIRFVDRFLGLVVHVVNQTALSRSLRIELQDSEDLTAEVFVTFLADDYTVLRRFRGESSLATYLTVIARRVVVRELLKWRNLASLPADSPAAANDTVADDLLNRDEVEQLLSRLEEGEAAIVKMHYLDGKSYEEISTFTGMSMNSIGPALSRAKAKMRSSSPA